MYLYSCSHTIPFMVTSFPHLLAQWLVFSHKVSVNSQSSIHLAYKMFLLTFLLFDVCVSNFSFCHRKPQISIAISPTFIHIHRYQTHFSKTTAKATLRDHTRLLFHFIFRLAKTNTLYAASSFPLLLLQASFFPFTL